MVCSPPARRQEPGRRCCRVRSSGPPSARRSGSRPAGRSRRPRRADQGCIEEHGDGPAGAGRCGMPRGDRRRRLARSGLGRPEPQAAVKPASPPAGRVPESWVGKNVVIKYAAPLMEGVASSMTARSSASTRSTASMAAGSNWSRTVSVGSRRLHDRTPKPPIASVVHRTDGINGWVSAADIVLLDQAIDFYTREIQANGRNVAARSPAHHGLGVSGPAGQSDARSHSSHVGVS